MRETTETYSLHANTIWANSSWSGDDGGRLARDVRVKAQTSPVRPGVLASPLRPPLFDPHSFVPLGANPGLAPARRAPAKRQRVEAVIWRERARRGMRHGRHRSGLGH